MAGFPDSNPNNQLVIKALQTLSCDVITSQSFKGILNNLQKDLTSQQTDVIQSDSYPITKKDAVDYLREKNSIN